MIVGKEDAAPFLAKQVSKLVETINEPATAFAEQNERLALAFLRLTFQPAKYDVIPSTNLLNPKSFVEICEAINFQRGAIIREKEDQIRALQSEIATELQKRD